MSLLIALLNGIRLRLTRYIRCELYTHVLCKVNIHAYWEHSRWSPDGSEMWAHRTCPYKVSAESPRALAVG